MSGEEQLERSVLERKERDELHAIAEAMALKPTSRAKKADLISLILRAAGVELAADGESTGNGGAVETTERPKRGRSTKANDDAAKASAESATARATNGDGALAAPPEPAEEVASTPAGDARG
ncbi:MAG: Rho termination factor N-terminal domain-containing protein, partial [Acidimicrobiales bacterium]|nr:Rho termination factor N-terminal domain-containing protein [Acidimicrobiales bacterium]